MALSFPTGIGSVVFHHLNRPDDGYTHVSVRFFFADVTNLQAFTNEQNGVTGTPEAADLGSIARVGGAEPYTFYILKAVSSGAPYTWQQIDGVGGGGGSGDVVGPASATANRPAVFDGATGKLIKEPNAAVNMGGQAITSVGTVDGRTLSTDGAKLDGIEAAADVTDEANVLPALAASAAAKDMGGGPITNVANVDGRDVSADGTQLDANTGAIATNAGAIATNAGAIATNAGAIAGHIADGANPHATGIDNIGPGTLAELNAAISNATLDDASANRTDANAIHGNAAGEISVITLKASPVAGDLLLIEDPAASNAKRRVTVGSLPGGGGVTDHGALTGLADDDHPQYLTKVSAVRLPSYDPELPAANGAIADAFTDQLCTTYQTGVTRNGRFRFELPPYYQGGDLRVRVQFAPSNTNTNNFRLQISFMRQELGHDMTSTTFATARLTTVTPAGVANILAEATDTFTNAQADTPSAGDMMLLNVQREGADAADTFTGDVRVYRVIVEEV